MMGIGRAGEMLPRLYVTSTRYRPYGKRSGWYAVLWLGGYCRRGGLGK